MLNRLAAVLLITSVSVSVQAQDGARVRIAVLDGMELPYEVVDGLAVHAGDIILGTAEEVAGWTAQSSSSRGRRSLPVLGAVPMGHTRSGLFCTWPDGIVPYVIDADVPARERQELVEAIRAWDEMTVLRFVPREPQHRDYVRFTFGTPGGAWRCHDLDTGGIGETRLQVEPNDSSGNLLHVIGHKIGLEHENQRRDRDRWLTVFRDNIAETPYARSAWHPQLHYGADVGVYDYRSIMHYRFIEPAKQRNHARPYAAETVPPGMPFGAAGELSPGDVDSVARLYGHVPAEHTVSTNPPGLEIIVDGERMTAPASFTWESDSEHTLEVPSPQFRDGARFLFGRWSDDGDRVHTITATRDTTLYQASFIAQHKVSTGVRVWCRDANPTCSPEDVSITVIPESPDGYYTLRTPLDVAATLSASSPLRLLWWDFRADYYAAFLRQYVDGTSSNPVRIFAMSGLTYEAVVGDGPVFRVESNVDPVRVSVGDWWGETPVVFPVPERFAGPTIVAPKPHDLRGAGFRHRFRSWSDGGDVTHALQVPPDADSTLTLNLDTDYRLTTRAWQSWHNRIETVPTSADGFYPEGTEVRLRAVAGPDSEFLGWNGAVWGREPTATVVMNDGQLAEAVFALDATELQPGIPVEVSLQGLRWDDTVPDFARHYIQPPAGASHIEVEFRTRAAVPREAGLFVADTDIWPNWVHQETADRVLRPGDVATITIPRPPRRWPAAYFILVRAPEADGGSPMLEGTLVVRTGGRSGNRSPQSRARLEDRTLGANDGPLAMDVARGFTDPDGDALTHTAMSSAETVATTSVWGSTVTVTPLAGGSATITVAATDVGGSNTTARQAFRVTVRQSFTDHPIVPGVTPVRAGHFTELRARIDRVRTTAGLGRFAWTDPVLTARATPVRLVHLGELRSALADAYAAAGRPAPNWTDSATTAEAVPIRAAHLMELRSAVLALEE